MSACVRTRAPSSTLTAGAAFEAAGEPWSQRPMPCDGDVAGGAAGREWSRERSAAEAARAAVFERGEAPVGEQKVEELCVEADRVLVRGRAVGKEKKRWIEVKLAVG